MEVARSADGEVAALSTESNAALEGRAFSIGELRALRREIARHIA